MVPTKHQTCTSCMMDTSDSHITFDEKGVCDHCRNYYEHILPNWKQCLQNKQALEDILHKIKEYGKGKPFDCMIGLSGGLDSSYLAYAAVKLWGLRPKFISIDTHWALPVAESNIQRLVKGLGIEVETIVIDWDELKDLQIAFLKSQVSNQDHPQDLAIFAASYNYAAKIGVRYFLNGGNYSTEGIREPVEWAHYNDMAQLYDIHRKFGSKRLEKYPTLGFLKKNIYYRYFKKINIVKLLDYLPYTRQEAIDLLNKEFGWEPYQEKHYENRFTRFYEGYWLCKKFGIDKRRAQYSSLVLSGQMSRNEALERLKKPPYDELTADEDLEFIAGELDMTKDEFLSLMKQPNKSWKDYKSNYIFISFLVRAARLLGLEQRNYR